MSNEKGKGKQVNRTEASAIFGVAMNTIDSWVRQGCPVLKRGTGRGNPTIFNTADVAQWLREKSVQEATGDRVADEDELKRRRLVADTELAELNLAKAKADVIPIDQAERMVSRAFAEVRAGMRNVPGRVVSQLIGETDERRFKSVLLEEIDQALTALAEADLAGDDEDQPDEAA
jgi:phage terminase Nu1 subunit (DNA packaging protein)